MPKVEGEPNNGNWKFVTDRGQIAYEVRDVQHRDIAAAHNLGDLQEIRLSSMMQG